MQYYTQVLSYFSFLETLSQVSSYCVDTSVNAFVLSSFQPVYRDFPKESLHYMESACNVVHLPPIYWWQERVVWSSAFNFNVKLAWTTLYPLLTDSSCFCISTNVIQFDLPVFTESVYKEPNPRVTNCYSLSNCKLNIYLLGEPIWDIDAVGLYLLNRNFPLYDAKSVFVR